MASGVKVGELYGELRLEKGKFDRDLDGAGVSFSKLGSIAVKAGAVAAAALAGVAIAATTMAVSFEKDMANVHTLLGAGSESERRIKELGADVKQMSVETGKPLSDLAGGLYQVVSAFGDSADSAEILRISAKASTAGLADTTSAVNLLSAVTKGYGDTSKEAVGKASDLAFQTVKLGQTTFPELAASMGKAIPLAKALGISQEELFGAMATLTGVTGNTAEVSTQLTRTYQALINSSPAMEKALKKIGYENGQAAIEALGFQGTLDKLAKSVDGDTKALGDLFPSVNALNAVLALTGPQADALTEKTLAMGQAAGMTQEAFDIQSATVSLAFDRVQAAIGVVLVNLGEKFLPMLQTVLDWVLAHMPEIQAFFEQAFAAVGAAIDWIVQNVIPPLVAIFQFIVDEIVPAVSSAFNQVSAETLPGLGDAFSVITDTVIPALGEVFRWIVENVMPSVQRIFDAFTTNILPLLQKAFAFVQGWIKDNWPLISKVVGQVAGAVKEAFNVIANIIEVVYPIVAKVAEILFPILGAAASVLLEVISRVFDAIGTVWKTASKVADTVVKAIFGSWEGLGKFMENVWKAVGNAVKGGINFMIGLINGMIGFINSIQIHIPGFSTPFGDVAKFDWGGMNLPKIPMLEVGLPHVPAPMLAMLHPGEAVLRKDQADDWRMGRDEEDRGGDTYNIYGVQPGDVEREVMRANRRLALEWALG